MRAAFTTAWIGFHAIDWTNIGALGRFKMPYAFGAQCCIDQIMRVTGRYGAIRALRLTQIAIYALFGDSQGHLWMQGG